MKYPKNRGNMYVVVREISGGKTALLASFSDAVDADNFKDACAAEWFDKVRVAGANFSVLITTYYG